MTSDDEHSKRHVSTDSDELSDDETLMSTASPVETEEKQAEADKVKASANESLIAKDYDKAIEQYTKAIELSSKGPNSHVYYSNRAAAYSYVSKFKEAEQDAKLATKRKPDYSKGWARLGFALYSQKDFAGAVTAYEKSLEIEPTLQLSKSYLEKAKEALKTPSTDDAMPDLSSMMGQGDMPDMASMMKDPKMMAMAQNMMKDPKMMAMAQNMMKDPKMMDMMRNMKK